MAKFLKASSRRVAAYIDLPDSPYHGALGIMGELSGEVRALHLATGRRIWAVDTAVKEVMPDTIPAEWENAPGKHRQGELVNTKLGPATVTGGPVQTPLGVVYRVKLENSGTEFDTWEHEMSPADEVTHAIVRGSVVQSMLSYPEVGEVAGDGCSVAEDDDGVYVKTHRSRSKSYPTFEDIPKKEVDQVATTAGWHRRGHIASDFKVGDRVMPRDAPPANRFHGDIQEIDPANGKLLIQWIGMPGSAKAGQPLGEAKWYPASRVEWIPKTPVGDDDSDLGWGRLRHWIPQSDQPAFNQIPYDMPRYEGGWKAAAEPKFKVGDRVRLNSWTPAHLNAMLFSGAGVVVRVFHDQQGREKAEVEVPDSIPRLVPTEWLDLASTPDVMPDDWTDTPEQIEDMMRNAGIRKAMGYNSFNEGDLVQDRGGNIGTIVDFKETPRSYDMSQRRDGPDNFIDMIDNHLVVVEMRDGSRHEYHNTELSPMEAKAEFSKGQRVRFYTRSVWGFGKVPDFQRDLDGHYGTVIDGSYSRLKAENLNDSRLGWTYTVRPDDEAIPQWVKDLWPSKFTPDNPHPIEVYLTGPSLQLANDQDTGLTIPDDWMPTLGHASEEKDPDHSFVYYMGQLKLVEWSHTNRHRQILKELLAENGKELVDDIDDTDIVAGTVTDGKVEFEGFASPELQEKAEKAIAEEISGVDSVNGEEPKADDTPKEITININIDGWSEKD